MEPLNVIWDRFMRLLPFLTLPNSCRGFHFELFYPYPDLSKSSDAAGYPPAAGPAAIPSPPIEAQALHQGPYLTCVDLNHEDRSRREPFC